MHPCLKCLIHWNHTWTDVIIVSQHTRAQLITRDRPEEENICTQTEGWPG